MTPRPKISFGKIAHRVGIVTLEDLEKARRLREEKGGNLEDILVEEGQDPVDVAIEWIRAHAGVRMPIDLDAETAGRLQQADVVVALTSYSLSHTNAREAATRSGTRLASMPGITEDMMKHGGMTADYHRVAELCWKLTEFLQGAREAEITTPLGTKLRLGLEGREPGTPPDTGLYLKPGEWGNLPAGEAYIAPLETQADGIAVVDGTIAQIGLPSQPVTLEFREGKVVRIEGGREAIQLRNLLESLEDENAYVIAELGIGTNEAARLTGVTVEDEKGLGTVHVAIGRNTGFGGVNMSKIHLDSIITNPTLKIDGKVIIENGQPQV